MHTFGSIDYERIFPFIFFIEWKDEEIVFNFFNEAINYFSRKALQIIEAKTTVQYKTIDLKSLIIKYILGLYVNKYIYDI